MHKPYGDRTSAGILGLRWCLALCLIAATMSSGTAFAQDKRAKGWVDASAFAAIPTDTKLAVKPPDRRRESLDYAERFAGALEKTGVAVSEDAAYELSFEVVEEVPRPAGSSKVSIAGSGGSSSDTDVEVSVTQPLPRTDAPTKSGGTKKARRFEVIATVRDGRGNEVWRGVAKVTSSGGDQGTLRDRIARSLVDLLGEDGSGPLLD